MYIVEVTRCQCTHSATHSYYFSFKHRPNFFSVIHRTNKLFFLQTSHNQKNKFSSIKELEKIEEDSKKEVTIQKNKAWKNFIDPINIERNLTCEILEKNINENSGEIKKIYDNLLNDNPVSRRNIIQSLRNAIFLRSWFDFLTCSRVCCFCI